MEPSIGWFRREDMSDDERRHALAHELGVPFVQLGRDDLAHEALVLIPEPLAREHNAVAYKLSGNELEVALLRLDDLEHFDFLRPRYRVLPRLTSRDSLTRALVYYQKHLRSLYGAQLQQSDSPTLLDTLLRHALLCSASDVHLHTSTSGLQVRYRINGVLREAMTLPSAAGRAVAARLRALMRLPGGAAREGRLIVDLGHGEDVSVRVAQTPVVGGEKIVLSLARGGRRGWSLESLGFHGVALERVHEVLSRRKGLVAVSGQGQTTLLYTFLDLLNTPELALASVEQSVGSELPRVAQTSLAETGLPMLAAVRAALKQDPDVLMVDRVEEREVGEVLAAAARRGVFVLAGCSDQALLPNPTLSITQQIVRRLCTKKFLDKGKLLRAQADILEQAGADLSAVLSALKEEGRLSKETPWKEVLFPKAAGCSECERGYQGQLGLQAVAHGGEAVGLNIVEDGVFKAAEGLTTLDEVGGIFQG